jgi:transcription antitermination factor NusG
LANEKKWYVVYTKPRWEKKIALLLTDKEIEHYCPLNKVTKQWSDRKKIVVEPLFKGYIFVCPNKTDKWDIKKIPGILNYVHWLGKPALVKESEINTIKKFLHEFTDVAVSKQKLLQHEAVRIKQGLMMNYKGIVLEVNGNKVKVKIDSMGLILTAIFEKSNLEMLG